MSTITWYIPSPAGPVATPTTTLPQGKVDHVAAGLARLPEQFRNKTKVVQFLTALLGEFQPLEDAMWDLLTLRGIGSAFGAQLDALGVLIGYPRGGLSDVDYQRYLRAKIATNRSRGVTEDLIKISNLVVNQVGVSTIEVVTVGPAAVTVRIRNTVPDTATQTATLYFLKKAKKSGVRLTLEIELTTEALSFTCGTCVYVLGAISGGATSVSCYSPNGQSQIDWGKFPDSGTLVFDEGTTVAESIAYSSKTTFGGTSQGFVLSAPTANAHNTGSSLTFVGAPGLGFGNSADAGQPCLTEASSATAGTSGGRMVKVLE